MFLLQETGSTSPLCAAIVTVLFPKQKAYAWPYSNVVLSGSVRFRTRSSGRTYRQSIHRIFALLISREPGGGGGRSSRKTCGISNRTSLACVLMFAGAQRAPASLDGTETPISRWMFAAGRCLSLYENSGETELRTKTK